VIGLEVHAQLLTQTKLFCGCSVAVGSEPNQHVCPTCLGLPGSLPVGNQLAIELAVRAALALGCTIHESSIFARKNYFYPDLPKGYQISQFEQPFSTDGGLDIDVDGVAKRAHIVRAHLEEDAGKNVHGTGAESWVDLNRAGTPLIEIVGAPDLRSSAEAVAYLRALREILMFVGANDGNLEEGSFRCDVNVSLRPLGETKLGTRTELKNINSFRFVQRAIEVEIARQAAILDGGGRIQQETRSFDPDKEVTRPLRSKADAHDYRYFPEPDLPPLVIDSERIEAQRALVGELPATLRRRWVEELGLSAAAAATLTQHPAYARFFQEVCARFPQPVKAANWILTEVLRDTTSHGLSASFPVKPAQVAELLQLVDAGKISGAQAKKIHTALVGTERSPAD
jgi:aspartyl-tRNA(Asn)/glutamyl-tRNA(Gln) amidotransferase subunit B